MLGPVEREVMAQLFAAIPEEMGAVLVRSARSPNIRERRDASAAIFSPDGELVAQAAHIPVHLGAMPESVRAIASLVPFARGLQEPDVHRQHRVGSDVVPPGRQVHRRVEEDRQGLLPPD